ncbi:MAG: hypothetical protein V4729_02825 [Pseudomonadota bacterium]
MTRRFVIEQGQQLATQELAHGWLGGRGRSLVERDALSQGT